MRYAVVLLCSLIGQDRDPELLTADTITPEQLAVLVTKERDIERITSSMQRPEREYRRRMRLMIRETAKDEWGLVAPASEIDEIVDLVKAEARAAKTDGTFKADVSIDKFNGLQSHSLTYDPKKKDRLHLLLICVVGSTPTEYVSVTMSRIHPINRTGFIGKNADFYADGQPIMRIESKPDRSSSVKGIDILSSHTARVPLSEFRSLMKMTPPIRIDYGDNVIEISERGQRRILEWIEQVEQSKQKDSP